MARLESENEEPPSNAHAKEHTFKVVIGPDDDDEEPPPKPPPKPKGLFEWITGLCRRRWRKSASHS